MGYRIELPLFLTASTIGASHVRKRVFVLAHRSGCRFVRYGELFGSSKQPEQHSLFGHNFDGRDTNMADCQSIRWEEWWSQPARLEGRSGAHECGNQLAVSQHSQWRRNSEPAEDQQRHEDPGGLGELSANVAHSSGRASEQRLIAESNQAPSGRTHARSTGSSRELGGTISDIQQERAAAERAVLPFFAPGPNDPRWPDMLAIHPHLAPALSKLDWFVLELRRAGLLPDELECTPKELGRYIAQKVPREATKSALRRVAHGMAHRIDELRVLGNGVVPVQGALAFIILARRAGLFVEDGVTIAENVA